MSVYRQHIATNFAYGTGPYLRTTELAIAVNDYLEKLGHKRLGIIVPHVYGVKQKEIMREEFGDFYKKHPREIIFDEQLGKHLKGIFYGDESYEHYLARWVLNVDKVSEDIHNYLVKKYGDQIVMELHRSPRVLYNIARSTGSGQAPSYFVSFAYIVKIYSLPSPSAAGGYLELLKKSTLKIREIEASHRLHFLTEPGTFSYEQNKKGVFSDEISVPPTLSLLTPPALRAGGVSNSSVQKGIFVTVTGISGLERLYREAKKLGLKVYSNDIKAVPFAKKASPHIIGNPNILFQFARSGWSSVWLSMLSGTPMVVPEWDKDDDPEIYFNNICIEKLGLGIVYRGQPLQDILKKAESLRPGIEKYNNRLLKKFGTLDGTRYTAERIVEDFLATR